MSEYVNTKTELFFGERLFKRFFDREIKKERQNVYKH